MVADDEAPVRRVALRILEDAGFEVEEATTGAEALEVWKQHEGDFCAVLLDLRMPVMGGEGGTPSAA